MMKLYLKLHMKQEDFEALCYWCICTLDMGCSAPVLLSFLHCYAGYLSLSIEYLILVV